MSDSTTKVCTKCGDPKPLSEFHKDKRAPDELRRWCKQCARAQQSIWSKANRAHLTQYAQEYREENRDLVRQINRKSYSKHQDERQAYDRQRRTGNEEYKRQRREARQADPEPHRANVRRSYHRTIEKRREYDRTRRVRAPEVKRRHARKMHLKKAFGLTEEQYLEMVRAQDGKCAICGKEPRDKRGKLCVDHSHLTNRVRSLLCRHCNIGIGMLNDDPDLVAKALEYLLKHRT